MMVYRYLAPCLAPMRSFLLFLFWTTMMAFCLAVSLPKSSLASSFKHQFKQTEGSQLAPLLPRSHFMEPNPIVAVKLSPDGKFLSYILRQAKHSELWLMDVSTAVHRHLFNNKDMNDAHWSVNSDFLFVENSQGVLGISTQPNSFPNLMTALAQSKDQYFYGVDPYAKHAVITSEKDFKHAVHQLMRVLPNGSKQLIYKSPKRVLDFLLDKTGKIAFVKTENGDGSDLWDLRRNRPKVLKHCQFYDQCSLQSYNAQQNQLLLKARFGQDLKSLFAIDLASSKTSLLHQDPKRMFDITDVIFDIKNSPRLIQYNDQFVSQYALDADTAAILDKLKDKFSEVVDEQAKLIFYPNKSFAVWLIRDIRINKSANAVYLYDARINQISQPLTTVLTQAKLKHSYLPDQYVAPKLAIHYQTSDGMLQFGYLTLPLGQKLIDQPLIVKPHGGPWSRTQGGFDSMSQFLTNRGLVVFEPNFRSSTGMGKDYVLSANGDFGKGRVQQDILDGLKYVLSLGVGNRDKLAIFGHSFGGFSVLTALAFSPTLFKVGVAGAAPTNLAQSIEMLSHQKQNDHQRLRQRMLKKLAIDINDKVAMQRMYQKSPDMHWNNITKPLYLLAGGKDDRVPAVNVKDFAIRLKQANRPISLLLDPIEGHSPKQDIAREAYAYVLERALAAHLDTPYQKDMSQNLRRYLNRHTMIDNNGVTPSL